MEAKLSMSPVLTIINGVVITATPSPSGNFWRAQCQVKNKKLTAFGRTTTQAFYRLREAVVAA